MFETVATETNEKDKKPEGTTNTVDQDKQGFPAVIVAISILACIWLLAGFTVFKCTAVIALVAQLIKIINSNSRTNKNEIDTPSSSQVSMDCSKRERNDVSSDGSTIAHHLTINNVGELVAEHDKDNEQRASVPTQMEQQISNDDFVGEDAISNSTDDVITQLSESTVNQISNLIAKDDTAAVLITPTVDNSTDTPSPIQVTTDTAVLTPFSNTLTIVEPIVHKSAFVTENVMKIAVSYSGKERKRVVNITRILKERMNASEHPDAVFFDQDFQHEICRLNGLSHLLSIYRQAQLVIVFLSPSYTDSRYCTGEWRTIAQRFLSNRKNKETTQVLLVKLGQYDMEQLDLVDSDFVVNGMRMSNVEIANIILLRWELVEKNLEHNKK